MTITIRDERTFNLFVPAWLDEMPLTVDAFRVYAHLVRRANGKGIAHPSYQSIGDACFAKEYGNARVRRRHAIRAVEELQAAGLVLKRGRIRSEGDQDTNEYILVDPHRSGTDKAEVLDSTGGHSTVPRVGTPQYPEGNHSEGNHISSHQRDEKEDKPKSISKKRRVGVHDDWVQAIVPVLYQTATFKALGDLHWRHVHQVRRKLESLGVTPSLLLEWYDKQWKTTWPGTTRSPKPSEVAVGVAAYMESKAYASPAEKPKLVAREEE